MVHDLDDAGAQRYLILGLPLLFAPFVLVYNFPAGLMIYWLTTNLWTTGQGFITRRLKPKPSRPEKRSSRSPAKDEPPAPGKAVAKTPAEEGPVGAHEEGAVARPRRPERAEAGRRPAATGAAQAGRRRPAR